MCNKIAVIFVSMVVAASLVNAAEIKLKEPPVDDAPPPYDGHAAPAVLNFGDLVALDAHFDQTNEQPIPNIFKNAPELAELVFGIDKNDNNLKPFYELFKSELKTISDKHSDDELTWARAECKAQKYVRNVTKRIKIKPKIYISYPSPSEPLAKKNMERTLASLRDLLEAGDAEVIPGFRDQFDPRTFIVNNMAAANLCLYFGTPEQRQNFDGPADVAELSSIEFAQAMLQQQRHKPANFLIPLKINFSVDTIPLITVDASQEDVALWAKSIGLDKIRAQNFINNRVDGGLLLQTLDMPFLAQTISVPGQQLSSVMAALATVRHQNILTQHGLTIKSWAGWIPQLKHPGLEPLRQAMKTLPGFQNIDARAIRDYLHGQDEELVNAACIVIRFTLNMFEFNKNHDLKLRNRVARQKCDEISEELAKDVGAYQRAYALLRGPNAAE